MKLQIEVCDRGKDENADIAVKAFELSQCLKEKWVAGDTGAKRRILEIVCLNFSLEGVTIVPEKRKPFDILVKGLISRDGRGGRS